MGGQIDRSPRRRSAGVIKCRRTMRAKGEGKGRASEETPKKRSYEKKQRVVRDGSEWNDDDHGETGGEVERAGYYKSRLPLHVR